METQDFGEFDNVVATLRKRVWRDRLVAALFVVGLVINFAALNVAVKAALAAPSDSASVYAADQNADPDAGLLVAHRDPAHQRIAPAQ